VWWANEVMSSVKTLVWQTSSMILPVSSNHLSSEEISHTKPSQQLFLLIVRTLHNDCQSLFVQHDTSTFRRYVNKKYCKIFIKVRLNSEKETHIKQQFWTTTVCLSRHMTMKSVSTDLLKIQQNSGRCGTKRSRRELNPMLRCLRALLTLRLWAILPIWWLFCCCWRQGRF